MAELHKWTAQVFCEELHMTVGVPFKVGNDSRRNTNGRPKGSTMPTFRTILESMPKGTCGAAGDWRLPDAPETELTPYQWALGWLIKHVEEGNWHALQDFLNRTVGKPAETLNLNESPPPDPFDDIDIPTLHRLIDLAAGSNGGNGASGEAGAGAEKPTRLP